MRLDQSDWGRFEKCVSSLAPNNAKTMGLAVKDFVTFRLSRKPLGQNTIIKATLQELTSYLATLMGMKTTAASAGTAVWTGIFLI